MREIINLLASYAYWIYFFVSSAVFCMLAGIACLLTAPFDPNRKLVHKVASVWGYHYVWVNPLWRCEFSGLENIDPNQTYVLAANHQSFWDIMVLYGLFRHFKWIAKDYVMRIPFIGWNMRLNQYVSVSSTDRSSIKVMLDACRHWLKTGSSIMIFPEGTRSQDRSLGQFKDGPFKLAVENNTPVVPIALDGTFDIMKKGSVRLNFRSNIRVRAMKPIMPEECGFKTTILKEKVFAAVKSAMAEWHPHIHAQESSTTADGTREPPAKNAQ